ncbi:hypothetical protein D7V94_02450 [Parablautia intestinalis]|uniref:Uncharacterized protein n=1 Tax=Parablautia intestinalis TaxID=2320100 RepID=A0A3A9AQE1_9FIRM|nr:hypothetical protein D7V94_02450 [Parablautia intestinalis]
MWYPIVRLEQNLNFTYPDLYTRQGGQMGVRVKREGYLMRLKMPALLQSDWVKSEIFLRDTALPLAHIRGERGRYYNYTCISE